MATFDEPENRASPDSGCRYTHFSSVPGSSHDLVVDLVPRGARVLEFGTATGYMSQVLRDRLDCTVTGIEVVPDAAEEARQFCERVITGDAETLDFDVELHDERFDAVLFADVLEHLKDPAAVLERVRPFVADNGVVVASIPNIAHGSVRLALLRGEFRYRRTGLLDETHLRFFTRESIEDLFESCGYVIGRWRRVRVDVDGSEIPVHPDGLPEGVREWLDADADATTFQFVISAVPAGEPAVLRSLREEAGRSRAELDAVHAQLAVAASQVAELETVRSELGTVQAALETARSELNTMRAEAEQLAIRVEEREAELETMRAAATELDVVAAERDATRARELELRSLLLQAHADLAQRDQQIVPPRPQGNWRRSASLRFPRTAAIYRRARGHPS